MKDRTGTPIANEFGKIRSMLAKNGVSQAQIKEAIGTGAKGRTRSEIADTLRDWLKGLPQA